MHIHVQVFGWMYVFIFLEYRPRSGTARSYDDSMFNILSDCQTVSHSWCTILHSREQRMRVLISPHPFFFFFFLNKGPFFKKIIYLFLFLAVLGLHFCVRAFSSCGKRGPLFIAVRGPLTIAASLVVEHRLQTHRLSSCGSWAQLLCGMWDLPRPGLEPVSPALARRFSTTTPPGKPSPHP